MKLPLLVQLKKLTIGIVALSICACSSAPVYKPAPPVFKKVEQSQQVKFATKEELALLEEIENPVYTIGKGDVLKLDVMGRPEVSAKMTVGPDGEVTVPLLGVMKLEDKTRVNAQMGIEKGLSQYYKYPVATLSVEEYLSLYVTVMGRVQNAGSQRFNHPPTLVEVLASSGAMPILDKQATLTKCAIMRGRDQVIWVNLKALMQGDIAYNMRLKRGDVVYIPDSADTAVYVLGEVKNPGSYRLTPRMSILDAISQAGGLTYNAESDEIGLYRPGTDEAFIFSLKDLIDPARKVNFAMEDGDVIYTPRSGMGTFGYILQQLSPALNVLTFGLGLRAITR